MKMKYRALSLLLSIVMVLAFMPTLAFADAEETSNDGTPGVEAQKHETPAVVDKQVTMQSVGDDWEICQSRTKWRDPDTSLYLWVTTYDDTLKLEYQLKKNGTVIENWTDLDERDEDDDLYIERDVEDGTYTFSVREKYDHTQIASSVIKLYTYPIKNGLIYWMDDENDNIATVEEYTSGITGNIVIPATMVFPDGKTRTITRVMVYAPDASSISIPASVTYIWHGVGLKEWDWDDETETATNVVPIPGFTIFGTTGTAAQAHAKKYGIKFRDLALEKEQARQGTPDKSLPKVKIYKPKAAKKAITVKWKKLSKKQLKKSKAQKIEIWVCPNKKFGPSNTIMKEAGKKKSSLKVKVPKKGTYYVKVRAIKRVKGVKKVGKWSSVRKIKVKK